MTTLRQAAQQALVALEAITRSVQSDHQAEIAEDAITALRTALEQQAEPVAWMFQHDETGRMNYVSNDGMHTPELFLKGNPRYALVCPLYTTPPQREWVGLTPEEVKHLYPYGRSVWGKETFEAIEKALKEKNT